MYLVHLKFFPSRVQYTKVVTNDQNGRIKVSIANPTNNEYTISSTKNSVILDVLDNSKPTALISSAQRNKSMLEGGVLNFTLNLEGTTISQATDVKVQISDSRSPSSFGTLSVGTKTSNGAIISVPTSGSVDVSLTTSEITTSTAIGHIDITILDHNNTYNLVNDTLRVYIKDSNSSVISLSSPSQEIVDEGSSFTFNIMSNPPASTASPVMVNLSAADLGTGHFSSLTVAGNTVTSPISITSASTQVTVSTTSVTGTITHGEINIAIEENNNESYIVSQTNSIQVGIKDLVKPRVSIASAFPQVKEGQNVIVNLSVDPRPISPLLVGISGSDQVNSAGHFNTIVGINAQNKIEIGTEDGVKQLSITTNRTDAIMNGQITLTLATSSDYTLGTSSINVKIIDSKPPTISMTSASDNSQVNEGNPITYRLSIDPPPPSSVTRSCKYNS